MKVFPFVVFSTWLKKAIVLTVCLYKIKDCETSVKENLTIIQPGMLQRRGNKSPPAGWRCFTGLIVARLPTWACLPMTCWCRKPQFGALKRIMSDIEESQQAAWVVFFKRLWVGRHASYACERIEALQKWNLHCMGPLMCGFELMTTSPLGLIRVPNVLRSEGFWEFPLAAVSPPFSAIWDL